MSSHKETDQHGRHIELVAAIILGTLALACFATQLAFINGATTRETTLFGLMQFVLTTGFSWFGTRAISKNEFEQNLKRFAISAYRRILDIERIIDRLKVEVSDMMSRSPSENSANLRVVDAIVTDSRQIVRSSIADWGDVIGDELLAIEEIRRLERAADEAANKTKKTDIGNTNQSEAETELRKKIESIAANLPVGLQIETSSNRDTEKRNKFAAKWMQKLHNSTDGLELTGVTSEQYGHDKNFNHVTLGAALTTRKTSEGALDIIAPDGMSIGRVQNNSPLPYDEFVAALETCYGTNILSLKITEHIPGQQRGDEFYEWASFQVTTEPISKKRKTSN